MCHHQAGSTGTTCHQQTSGCCSCKRIHVDVLRLAISAAPAAFLQAGGTLAVKVVALQQHMGPGREAALRREALVLELAAMQDYRHPHLMPMQVRLGSVLDFRV